MDWLLPGSSIIFDFWTILAIFAAVFLGVAIGSLPGLSAVMGVAIISPFTYSLPPQVGILSLVGIYVGANYGGSICATLLNIPGTPAAVATTFDAYPMAKGGQAGRAIGIATLASAIGGLLSAATLILISPLIAEFALRFTSIEMFSVAVLGLSILILIAEKNHIKSLIAAIIGLLIATVGGDPMTSYPRFTFDRIEIYTGINFIIVMIGIFGASEVFGQVVKERKPREVFTTLQKVFPGWGFVREYTTTILRSSLIGIFVGAIPGTGATIASIVSYGQAKRWSKRPELMGHGSPEGIVASETANNACCGGAITTMLSLGIPGDAVTAIIIGQFMIHGLRPGPVLFTERPDLVSAIFIGFILANLFMLAIGLSAARLFARLLTFPVAIIQPLVLALCVVGAFAIQNSIFDVQLMVLFTLLGYGMRILDIPRAPLVLALILGPMAESNLRRSITIYGSGTDLFSAFWQRPLAMAILLVTVAMVVYPLAAAILKKRKGETDNG
ncbi:MAG: tripartite tricarboxylate transporter permease [Planctomycetes bacterium]|nr:tripartite tricarboxylate transporter permease [Planctomycetota bacterium]